MKKIIGMASPRMAVLLVALSPAATITGQDRDPSVPELLPGYVVQKVADTQTPVPDGSGDFTDFGVPSIGGGTVAFRANGEGGQSGVYARVDGVLARVADRNTPVPGGVGNLFFFNGGLILPGDLSVSSDGSVAFMTLGYGQGLYTNQGGALSTLVDTSFSVPGNPGHHFGGFGEMSYDAGRVAFNAVSDSFVHGLYLADGVSVSLVADQSTPIPRGLGTFTDFVYPSLHGAELVFIGAGDRNQSGIYGVMGGALRVIVDRFTLIPGTSRRFGRFNDSSNKMAVVRDGEVAFQNDGVYVMRTSGLVTIADSTTPMPATLRRFTQFGAVGFDQGKVAFDGWSGFTDPINGTIEAFRWGAYTDVLGPLRAIVSRSLLFRLDGKVVDAVFSSAEGFRDGVIGLTVWFFDGSKGVYIAQPR